MSVDPDLMDEFRSRVRRRLIVRAPRGLTLAQRCDWNIEVFHLAPLRRVTDGR